MLSASHQVQAPTQMRRKEKAGQWISWHICGYWSQLSSPTRCPVVSTSEWPCGLGYRQAGREMAGLKCRGTDQRDHSVTCGPKETISFPSGVWAHRDPTQIHARSAARRIHRLPNAGLASLYTGRAPKFRKGKHSDSFLQLISNT